MGWHEKAGQRIVRKEFWVSLLFVTFVLLFLNLMRSEPCWNATFSLRVLHDTRKFLNCARLCFKMFHI
jgi:hypothetical protein